MTSEVISHQIKFKPKINSHILNAFIDLRIHTLYTHKVLLIVPGVDGGVDGYKRKYIKIADRSVEKG
jgi:hypothetical protein